MIRGRGEVPRERCLSCHNRKDDLARINDHVFMHAKHVTEHKIYCLLCHAPIEDSLDRNKLAHAAADCQSCHPAHHTEQLEMLEGKSAGPFRASERHDRRPGRVPHLPASKVSSTGTVLWRNFVNVHNVPTMRPRSRSSLPITATPPSLPELETVVGRVAAALKSASLSPRARTLAAELDNVRHDLEFLQSANDVHNITLCGQNSARR